MKIRLALQVIRIDTVQQGTISIGQTHLVVRERNRARRRPVTHRKPCQE